MGRWGIFHEDSDDAADWFDELLERTGLPEIIEETLSLEDVVENHEAIRAAAYVVSFFARPFMWPTDAINPHLELAIRRLEEMLQSPEWLSLSEGGDPEYVAKVRDELDFLRSILKSSKVEEEASS